MLSVLLNFALASNAGAIHDVIPLLIIVLPFSSFLICALLGYKLKKGAGLLSLLLVGSSSLLCLWVFVDVIVSGKGNGELIQGCWMTIHVGSKEAPFVIPLGYLIDPLTSIMLFVVGFVGWWIMLYSIGYMDGDPRYHRYFAYMSLFMASMLGLVLSNNFVMLYICWELVGLCSYLLIGFWYERETAMRACKKAFIVTRLGDTGFALGIFILVSMFGSVAFYPLDGVNGIFTSIGRATEGKENMLALAAMLLFCGAVGVGPSFACLASRCNGRTNASQRIDTCCNYGCCWSLHGRKVFRVV
jgi:NADH-quinone oxidoreductase subunit L